jgi:hypothetical protein
MGIDTTTRRRFLAAAITLAGSTTLQPLIAWAQSGSRPAAAMVRMARLLYPHDALADDVYAEVLGDALSAATQEFADMLDLASAELDARTGGDFLAADEADQIVAMRAIENDAAFSAIRATVRDGVYQHPACWELIGYGGPSFKDGGYLHRGAGEIDWLPEGEK